jgi:hypothetical protein
VIKILFIFLSLTIYVNASILVVKSSEDIEYRNIISKKNTYLVYEDDIPSYCTPITKDDVQSNKLKAKVFIKKNRIICKKNVYIPTNNKLIFDFGSIKIETDGKIIKETDNFYKIKNNDGKIETIYKDGRLK